MKVDLTPEQDDVVQHAVQTGRLRNPVEAVQEAMDLWVERERRRIDLLSRLDTAEASLAAGAGVAITEDSTRSLATEALARNRHRFRS